MVFRRITRTRRALSNSERCATRELAARLLRDHRRLFREAGYRVVGRTIAAPDDQRPLPHSLTAFEAVRITGVSLGEGTSPRLLIVSGMQQRFREPVKIPVYVQASPELGTSDR